MAPPAHPQSRNGYLRFGPVEFADVFPDQDEAVRIHVIEAKIFLAYKKDLSNLNLQEARLRRQREKDEARLKEVQALRRQQEAAAQPRLDQDAKLYIQTVHEGKSEEWEPERAIASPEGMSLGFEFTIEQIEMRALQIEPDLFHEWALSHRKDKPGRTPAQCR